MLIPFIYQNVNNTSLKENLKLTQIGYLTQFANLITTDMNSNNIDLQTIKSIGLRLTNKPLTIASQDPTSRVFEYPHLKDVYIMESDLYGNVMPHDSCFIAFNGQHGLIGKHMKVEKLKKSTLSDIEKIVQSNNEG